MRFLSTSVDGVYLVEIEAQSDERGSFARLYCPEEFAAAGIPFTPRQTSLSRNNRRLTLRGLHYTTEHAVGRSGIRHCLAGAAASDPSARCGIPGFQIVRRGCV